MIQLSNLINGLSESQTIRMAQLGRELASKGVDVISLSLGEPDFNTPEFVKDAAKKAIDENYSFYTPVAGYLDLRKAIVEKLKKENNLSYTPEQIVVTTGAKQAIINTMLCLLNAGDEVLIPTPYWVSYSAMAYLAGGECKFVDAGIENDFKITPQQLENAITPKTKLFIFSSPCNPTGSVYTQEELEGLAKIFAKYPNVYVISDEIYEYINFIGKHASIASFDEIKDRVIVINGLSKGFAMTGWRLGYIAAHPIIAKAVDKLQGQFTSGTTSITQRAAITACQEGIASVQYMKEAFLKRRDLVYKMLKEITGLKVNLPAGAFYFFPDVSYYLGKKYGKYEINNTDELCIYLLEDAHVSLVTGDAFGAPNAIRISYATSEDKLIEACKRIKASLEKLA